MSVDRKTELPLLDRSAIATRITDGSLLFIYHSQVVNATSWATFHPGGALAILHFVGRDASDEVDAYHSLEAISRLKKFIIARVELDEEVGWRPLTPPIALGLVRHPNGVKGDWAREGAVRLGTSIQGEEGEPLRISVDQLEPAVSTLDLRKEKERSTAYRELREKIVAAGLFERPGPLGGYGKDIVRYASLGGAAFGMKTARDQVWLTFSAKGALGQLGSALFLGLFYHQLTCE
jgi:delta8-fatty-acid desaturase